MTDALVLAGAVVKGAFTAGALSVLSEPATKARVGVQVTRIVGASSGALNGLYYAAAIRAGDEASAGQRLSQLWLDEATLTGVFDVSLRELLGTRGISTENKLTALMRRQVQPGPGKQPIELRLVVTNVGGEPISIDGRPATTFEHVVDVTGADFESASSLERVFLATAASAALPGVFAPVTLPVGPGTGTLRGLDGGLVDNTPLGHALAGAPDIDRLFVIVPSPRVRAEPGNLHGLDLASHVFDMVVEERLIRDLRHVARVNQVMGTLLPLLPDPTQRAAVLAALGWSDRRPVKIIEIRPESELPGNSFSGFASRDLRQRYVKEGTDAARRALDALG